MTTTPQPHRPTIITIDADGGYIHCLPDQSPAELLEHAVSLAVTAIITSIQDSALPDQDAATIIEWVTGALTSTVDSALQSNT